MRAILSLFITFSAAVAGLHAQAAPEPNQVALDRYQRSLDSLVPQLLAELATPGAAVAMIRDGKVVLAQGYGYADREQGELVTSETLFNIGSISKTVAAWGLLSLVEAGKLDLDAPVERYLTRWHLPPSEFDHDDVTLRRLLSHTAGLRLHGYPGFHPDSQLPILERSLAGETNGSGDVRVIMEPGTKWQYSGGGFTIAQLIVEEVTGQRFAEFMTSEVLEPLGMTSSSYVWNAMVERLAAVPYGSLAEPIPGPRFTAAAAAGLQTSLEDFTRFALASMSGARPNLASGVLQPATVAMMQERVPASPNYGLGYGIFEVLGDKRAVGHGGANAGWMARFLVVPETGDGLVVMTNSTNGGAVHNYLFCEWGHAELQETGRCRKPIARIIVSVIEERGVGAAVAHYRHLRQSDPDGYVVSEGQLNQLGYGLLQAGRVDDAVVIFQLNVETFPEASNTYDSLGEAHMVRGDKELAIANYEKSLELNPDNQNAKTTLQRLRGR